MNAFASRWACSGPSVLSEAPTPVGTTDMAAVWRMLAGWLGTWFRAGTSLGDRGEELAARHLAGLGMTIVARRYRTRLGEIDLIARDGEWLVFVEVKSRKGTTKGHPFDAVDSAKQRRLIRLAEAYLADARRRGASGMDRQRVRFDIVAVIERDAGQPPVVQHLPHAFRG